ncbi:hypothetical protein L21SP3_02095 [Sedimentisphaera cyanobacteriorum]|uniref:DUF5009 domain-containing protein n=2 Tax=Sedimentisphaera cyanobacteriorum TaxID=1940790 RepID=A0A1Q2HS38_9BACT|nr:hypothetical protein L21SP3_02095 [Sedimentisphaera cyanobacteriorum]
MSVQFNSISEPKRIYSLDILRGIAILLMLLANNEPFGSLPSWMYHAQTPPPTHQFNPQLPGLTWVDLVFPFFIFSMGAAIPLSLERRLNNGLSKSRAVLVSLKRWFFLVGFAVYAKHISPYYLADSYGEWKWVIAILLYLLMFSIWGRLPWAMHRKIRLLIKSAGIAAAAVFFAFADYGDKGFDIYRNDIILFVLSNLAFWGALCWILTRNNIVLRFGVLAFILAVRLVSQVDGSWISQAGSFIQVPFLKEMLHDKGGHWRWVYDYSWFLNWSFLKYLFIIIPATAVGDLFNEWARKSDSSLVREWSRWRYLIAAFLVPLLIITTLVGLQSRLVLGTFAVGLLLSAAIVFIARSSENPTEFLLNKLIRNAVFWYLLGLILEPYEGGIKKDPSTISYYFVTAGLAGFSAAGIIILVHYYGLLKYLKLFVYNGQNPMAAYLAAQNVFWPALALINLREPITGVYTEYPWLGFCITVILVAAIGIWVSLFSKKKIYLRT